MEYKSILDHVILEIEHAKILQDYSVGTFFPQQKKVMENFWICQDYC